MPAAPVCRRDARTAARLQGVLQRGELAACVDAVRNQYAHMAAAERWPPRKGELLQERAVYVANLPKSVRRMHLRGLRLCVSIEP